MTTRMVPSGGLPTWPEPDPNAATGPSIAAGNEVEVLEERELGWTRVRCSNGWEAWVDGTKLVAPGTPLTAAGPGAAANRNKLVVGALAAALVVAFLVTRDGDSGSGSPGSGGGGGGGEVLAALTEEPTGQADAELSAAVADARAANPVAPSGNDEAAQEDIANGMRAAGYEIGEDLLVMPLTADTNLAHLELGTDSPLLKLPQGKSDQLLPTLLSLPALAEHKVSRLAIVFSGNDQKGPFRLGITGTLGDMRAAFVDEDEAARKRLALEVIR